MNDPLAPIFASRRLVCEMNFIVRSVLILSAFSRLFSTYPPRATPFYNAKVWDYVPETLQTAGVAKTSYALLGVSSAVSLGLAAV